MEKNLIVYRNTMLYTYMKRLFSTAYKLTDQVKTDLLKTLLNNNKDLEVVKEACKSQLNMSLKRSINKIDEYTRLIDAWTTRTDMLIFMLALLLMLYKNDICLKITRLVQDVTSSARPLTLEYDNISVEPIYTIRAITLTEIESFLNKLTDETPLYKQLSELLTPEGVNILSCLDPIISESLKQAAISSGGEKYETLIYNYLHEIGLNDFDNNIQRFTHEENRTLENDFEFTYNGKKFGISSKKTLRERYKQYVNTHEAGTSLDIMFTITLGADLNKYKAETLRSYGVYVFVAPEVYAEKTYLQHMDGIYSIFDLNIDLLNELTLN